MLEQHTLDQLRQLRLGGMIDALQQQREQPDTHDLSFEERFAFLVQREVLHRENRRLARLLKDAKLRVNACVENIDYRHPRGLERSRMASLAQLGWLREAQNLMTPIWLLIVLPMFAIGPLLEHPNSTFAVGLSLWGLRGGAAN